MGRPGYKALRFITWPVRWVLSGLFHYGLMLTMPSRGKRIFYTVALYAHLKQVNYRQMTADEVVVMITDLDELLGLVSNPRSLIGLRIPLATHDAIFQHSVFPALGECKDISVHYSAMEIARCAPVWLRYDHDLMIDDVHVLLRRHLGKDYLPQCKN